ELDPKNPQTWYLLGASLVYKMTLKKVGDKEIPEFAPGTIEAYQKAIELDPMARTASRPRRASNSCSKWRRESTSKSARKRRSPDQNRLSVRAGSAKRGRPFWFKPSENFVAAALR